MSIEVSVVIPTYKRPELLNRCLNALMNQDLDPETFELIVVDNAACEETRAFVDEYMRISNIYRSLAGEFNGFQNSGVGTSLKEREAGSYSVALLSAVRCPRFIYLSAADVIGPAAARNVGWRAAQGAIIAFTDDDCIPEPDWLMEGVATFDGDIVGVSGRVEVPIPLNPTDYEKNAAQLSGALFVTANCFYLRSVLEEVGGFDERFPAAWREDADLYFTLLSRSYKLKQNQFAAVNHPVRPASWGISLKQQKKAMYNALLYKKHPGLYRQHIQSRPPMRYYSILLAAVLGVAALLLQEIPLAIFFWGAWAAQTAVFALQRLLGTRYTPQHIWEMIITSILIPPLSIFWRLFGAVKYRVLFF